MGRTQRVRVRKYSQASGLSDWVYAGDLPWGGTPGEGQALSRDTEFCFQRIDFVVDSGSSRQEHSLKILFGTQERGQRGDAEWEIFTSEVTAEPWCKGDPPPMGVRSTVTCLPRGC